MRFENGSQLARHAIGVVVRRTGLLADRIRAWERRYGAVEPARSATGRRLYSDADVYRLRLLRAAVDDGHSIGAVAHLDDRGLLELVAGGAPGAGESPGGKGLVGRAASRELDVHAVRERALDAVRRLDRRSLEEELTRTAARLSCAEMVERVLAPLMARVGELWRTGEMRPVQEHMASAVLRSFVGTLADRRRVSADAPKVVVSTPVRQRHEMGAVVVAACAAGEGWQPIYLGPDVAAEEIAAAARGSGARAVALSITFPPDDQEVSAELGRLGSLLPDGVELLVGGQGAPAYRDGVAAAGGRLVLGLADLRRRLAVLVDGDALDAREESRAGSQKE